MISGWAVAAIILIVLLFGVVIVLLMRIMTQNELIIRAIPFGPARIQERVSERIPERRPAPTGSSASGQHHRTTQEI